MPFCISIECLPQSITRDAAKLVTEIIRDHNLFSLQLSSVVRYNKPISVSNKHTCWGMIYSANIHLLYQLKENRVMLLAGDIGGTKTNLAVFSPEKGWRVPLVEKTFPSSEYLSLEAIVHEFLAQEHFSIERASFGVAGPVVGGHATITNLPWMQ